MTWDARATSARCDCSCSSESRTNPSLDRSSTQATVRFPTHCDVRLGVSVDAAMGGEGYFSLAME